MEGKQQNVSIGISGKRNRAVFCVRMWYENCPFPLYRIIRGVLKYSSTVS